MEELRADVLRLNEEGGFVEDPEDYPDELEEEDEDEEDDDEGPAEEGAEDK